MPKPGGIRGRQRRREGRGGGGTSKDFLAKRWLCLLVLQAFAYAWPGATTAAVTADSAAGGGTSLTLVPSGEDFVGEDSVEDDVGGEDAYGTGTGTGGGGGKDGGGKSEGKLCWDTEGPFEKDCFHEETLMLNPYPLTPEMLERSVPYEASDQQVHRAFQRAREKGLLRVLVLGGSVTFGHKCVSPGGFSDNDCAWPHRLEQWFRESVRDFAVEVTNAAVPGSGIMQFLHKKMAKVLQVDAEVDLIIVDFGVNDAIIERFDFNLDYVKMAHEVLIRHVRNDMLYSPALLYAESFISPCRAHMSPWQSSSMAEVHAIVTRKYDIPMASFRHAVWPDIDDSFLADEIWGQEVHPGWEVHQLLADVVVYYLEKSYARFLQVHGPVYDPSPAEEEFSRFRRGLGCLMSPLAYSVDLGSYLGRPPPAELRLATGWSFLKLAGVPGLTGFGNFSSAGGEEAPAAATFDLPCTGDRRILEVEYLVSYIGMGAVRVSVDSGRHRDDAGGGGGHGASSTSSGGSGGDRGGASVAFFEGLWGSHASVPWFETIDLPKLDGDGDGTTRVTFEVLSAELEKSLDPPSLFLRAGEDNKLDGTNVRGDRKFKLISLQCC